jgi:hypothetical protein
VDFVARTSAEGDQDFIPPANRIAVFDNDGTLWTEQPIPCQLAFALDRVKDLAPQHPEWTTTEPFASLLQGDLPGALTGGGPAVAQIAARWTLAIFPAVPLSPVERLDSGRLLAAW